MSLEVISDSLRLSSITYTFVSGHAGHHYLLADQTFRLVTCVTLKS